MGTTFFCKANCSGISLRVGSMLEAFFKSQNHKMNAQLNLNWIKILIRIVSSHFKVSSLSLDMSVFRTCACMCACVHPHQVCICLCLGHAHICVHVCILIRSSSFQLLLFFHFEKGSLTEFGIYKLS